MLLDMWLHFKSLNDVHKELLSSSKFPFLSTILIKIIQKKTNCGSLQECFSFKNYAVK